MLNLPKRLKMNIRQKRLENDKIKGCKKVAEVIGSWWFLVTSFTVLLFPFDPVTASLWYSKTVIGCLGEAAVRRGPEGEEDWARCWRSEGVWGWHGFNRLESVPFLSLWTTAIPSFGKQPACSLGHWFHIQIAQKPAFPCGLFSFPLCLVFVLPLLD